MRVFHAILSFQSWIDSRRPVNSGDMPLRVKTEGELNLSEGRKPHPLLHGRIKGRHIKSFDRSGMRLISIGKIEGLIQCFPPGQFQRYVAMFRPLNKICGLFLTAILTGALSITPSSSAIQSSTNSDSFRPWLSCQFDDGLEIVQTERLPKKAERFRMVKTDNGEERVSRIDGYRVMFRYPDTDYYFANVKVEQSNPQEYAKDKKIVIEGIKHVAAAEKDEIFNRQYNNFETIGTEDPVIDRSGVIAVYVLFSDDDQKIISIYMLNQGRRNRRFKTIEEFRVLRDNFLNRYTTCARAKH